MTTSPANPSKNRWLWITLAATLTAAAWLSLQDNTKIDAEDSGIKLNASRKSSSSTSSSTSSNSGSAYTSQPNNQAGQGPHTGAEASAFAEDDASAVLAPEKAGLRPRITSEPLPLFSAAGKSAAAIAAENTAPPEMPGLPFTYAGKLMEDGKYTVFLLTAERSLAVHRGDVLESAWRVKEIRPPRMTFYYLPLKRETSLDIGSAMDASNVLVPVIAPSTTTPIAATNNEQGHEQPVLSQQHIANHPGAETTPGERN